MKALFCVYLFLCIALSSVRVECKAGTTVSGEEIPIPSCEQCDSRQDIGCRDNGSAYCSPCPSNDYKYCVVISNYERTVRMCTVRPARNCLLLERTMSNATKRDLNAELKKMHALRAPAAGAADMAQYLEAKNRSLEKVIEYSRNIAEVMHKSRISCFIANFDVDQCSSAHLVTTRASFHLLFYAMLVISRVSSY